MIDMKYGEIYLTKYLGLQRTFKKVFNVMTLVLSVSGILGWKFFENYAWIAFILIAIMQLFILIENQLICSDKEIDEIAELKMAYSKYFNKLERLWTESFYERVDDNEALDKYFELKETYGYLIESIDAKLNIKSYKRIKNQAHQETMDYKSKFLNYE